ncbi:MAG: polysaccharide deacetylase family protein [Flavobacterium sp.]|nr:polysaccharide deacetylase family protein [Flavobacterium sp.]
MLKHKNISVLSASLLLLLLLTSFFLEVKWWCFLVVWLFWLGLTAYGAFDIRANYFTKTYCSNLSISTKKITITFDDGPTEFTSQILDVLKQFNAKATFFCIGIQIEKNPEIFKRIYDEGHLIGNHSYSHSNAMGFFSVERVLNEIQQNDQLIASYLNKKPKFYRPPFGVTNPKIARALAVTQHHVIGWNNRSLDTVINEENTILNRIKKKVNPGGIVLLHDTSFKTLQVLEQLLLFLQTENYEVTPLDELLNLKAYEE